MNILNLQSLNRKLAKNRLSKSCFLSIIIISNLFVASCASSKQARIEPCSYADSVKDASFRMALDTCRNMANQGDAVSQKNLGYMYYFGNERLQANQAESVKWFKLAAAQGNKSAQYRLDMIVGGTEFTQLSQ